MKMETTSIARITGSQAPMVRAGFFDMQSFELMQRIAKGFASSTLVPREYQNNVANCMIALNVAQRQNGDPLAVMQNLVIVHGKPTWSAQYLIATANMCGRFSAIRFEFFGDKNTDSWGCRAWAIEKDTQEKLVGSDVTVEIAKREGWYAKNGSKWQSIPQQMLMYRAGAWWVRIYAPELSMGLMTAEEAHDVIDVTPEPERKKAGSTASIGELIGDAPAEPVEPAHNPAQLEAIAAIKSATTKADIARALSSLKPKDKDAVRPIAEERQAEIAAPATPDPETGEIVTDGEWLAGFDGQPAQ